MMKGTEINFQSAQVLEHRKSTQPVIDNTVRNILLILQVEREMAETLDNLSSEELDNFKSLIEVEEDFPTHSRSQLKVQSFSVVSSGTKGEAKKTEICENCKTTAAHTVTVG